LYTYSQYKILTCISGIDYFEDTKRFELVYELLGLNYNNRLRIKTKINDFNFVFSVTNLFPCANWWEREIWDFFGIFFINNYDLRRILTDYGFEGHPLKKCFPLSGYIETKYNENQKRVIFESIKQLPQEFKNFNLLNSWNN
jgi:NADH-quinone oxidoreductase subunit C